MKQRISIAAVLLCVAAAACSEPIGVEDRLPALDSGAEMPLATSNTSAYSGIVAWYPMDGDATDASGNALDGTISGAVTTTTDRFGRPAGALLFDGAGSHVQVASSPLFDGLTGEFSLAFWMRRGTNDLTSSIPVVRRVAGTDTGIHFLVKIHPRYGYTFQFSGVGQPSPYYTVYEPVSSVYGTLNDGGWHMVTVTFVFGSGSAPRLYLDGQHVPAYPVFGSSAYPAAVAGQDIFMGKQVSASPAYYNGALDDVRIFSEELLPSEVADLFAESLDPSELTDCLNGGWVQLGFTNQGQCVRFLRTGGDSRD